MSPVLVVHEFALVLTFIIGLIFIFKRNKGLRITHLILGITTLVTVIVYLIQDSFSNMGYNLYGVLLLLVFGSMFLKKRSLPLHIGLFVVSIVWLVASHFI